MCSSEGSEDNCGEVNTKSKNEEKHEQGRMQQMSKTQWISRCLGTLAINDDGGITSCIDTGSIGI